MLRGWLVLAIACAACSDPVPPDRTVEAAGAHAVGTARFVVHDTARTRDLIAQAWYPTDGAGGTTPIEMLEADPPRTRYATLLSTSPACATRTLPAVIDAPASTGTFPLVLISHCHACTRLSNATTAIRLASHGFVVVSVEHAGDTLWEHLDGVNAPIDGEELELRAADVRATLDQIAAGGTPASGIADLAHVGVLGHSMGAVTAGRVAQLDSRIGAAAALCAPMENPLVPGVMLSQIAVPLMFVVAKEDNSITEFGNKFIRDNFTNATSPAYKIEVPDAGHWSVSDLDGLVDIFQAGCGDAVRQTDGTDFTYIDPSAGRGLAASYATAFFKATLLDEPGSRAYVESAASGFGVSLEVNHHD